MLRFVFAISVLDFVTAHSGNSGLLQPASTFTFPAAFEFGELWTASGRTVSETVTLKQIMKPRCAGMARVFRGPN